MNPKKKTAALRLLLFPFMLLGLLVLGIGRIIEILSRLVYCLGDLLVLEPRSAKAELLKIKSYFKWLRS